MILDIPHNNARSPSWSQSYISVYFPWKQKSWHHVLIQFSSRAKRPKLSPWNPFQRISANMTPIYWDWHFLLEMNVNSLEVCLEESLENVIISFNEYFWFYCVFWFKLSNIVDNLAKLLFKSRWISDKAHIIIITNILFYISIHILL